MSAPQVISPVSADIVSSFLFINECAKNKVAANSFATLPDDQNRLLPDIYPSIYFWLPHIRFL